MPGNQLNLGIGKPLPCQVGQHLVAEKMGVDVLGDACLVAVSLDDLLYAPCGIRQAALGFKEIMIIGVCLEMAADNKAEARRKQDVSVLARQL